VDPKLVFGRRDNILENKNNSNNFRLWTTGFYLITFSYISNKHIFIEIFLQEHRT
jgi:hypothetical protein